MNTGKLIFAILSNDNGVKGIAGDRIFPLVAPQGEEKPLIVYQTITSDDGFTFDGDDGLRERRVQVDCWADTYKETQDLADAVRTAIQGATSPVAGIRLLQKMHENKQDLYDSPSKKYRVSEDYLLTHD